MLSGKMRMSRTAATFWIGVLSMPVCVKLLDGFHADSLGASLAVGVALGLAYVLIRPLLKLLTLPIGCLTLGLFGFVIYAGLILFCARLFPGFSVDGFGWALAAALFISLISAIVSR